MKPILFTDIVGELEHLFETPVRLTTRPEADPDARKPKRTYDFVIGDWTVVDDKPSYYVKRKLSQLLLNGWTGWYIHHDHDACDEHHDGRHNKRSFQLDYANEGQLYGLVIQRAELSPLSCALAPVPDTLNKVLTSDIMRSTVLGPQMGSLNTIGEPLDRDLFEPFCNLEPPLSMTRLGLDSDKARELWETAVERIELAQRLFLGSSEEILD